MPLEDGPSAEKGELVVVTADGAERRTVATGSNFETYSPTLDWSPDGSRIAFTSDRDGGTGIYVMNADGSGPTRLTDSPAGDFLPTWSADGSKIAFISSRDGNREVYVINADGSGQTNLTKNPAYDVAPTWSPATSSTSGAP